MEALDTSRIRSLAAAASSILKNSLFKALFAASFFILPVCATIALAAEVPDPITGEPILDNDGSHQPTFGGTDYDPDPDPDPSVTPVAAPIDGGATVVIPIDYPSPWNPGGGLTVGSTGEGTLVVQEDGEVRITSGNLTVGYRGNGTLEIKDGGVVIIEGFSTTLYTKIGDQSGAIGNVTVSGEGSRLETGTIFLGASGGEGTLTIENGGTVFSDGRLNGIPTVEIGNTPTASGHVFVKDTGSTWTHFGSLAVGYTGTGTLEIKDGGVVKIESDKTASPPVTGSVIIGYRGTSDGSVTVSGPGSEWKIASWLAVGWEGKGSLEITDGGVVSSGGHLESAVTPIGYYFGSTGSVMVRGTDSRWETTTPVYIGEYGDGTLTVTDNGYAGSESLYVVGFAEYSVGALNIATGGTVENTNTYVAYHAGSKGTINIGSAVGSAPVAPGTLNAEHVVFKAGDGLLVFNHTDTSGNYIFAPVIKGGDASTGTHAVDVYAGTTVLTGVGSDYFAPTTIYGGILAAGKADVFSPNSDYDVRSAGGLDLRGNSQIVGSLTNAGLINMGTGTTPGTELTTSSYTGLGGATIALNTFLGADGSPSDKLVTENPATGNSQLRITNAGGAGAITINNGILVVETINGGTTGANAFSLSGPVMAGPYDYTLVRGGLDGSDPDNYYLRSTGHRPETSVYTVLPSIALLYGRSLIGTLHERVGEQEDIRGRSDLHQQTPNTGGWGRIFGAHGKQDGDEHGIFGNGPQYDYDFFGIQVGQDLFRAEHADGRRDHIGFYFAYGNADGEVTHFNGKRGTNEYDAYTLGGYWTHFGESGWYIDTVLHATYYDTTSSAYASGIPDLETHGTGLAVSVEAGKPFRFDQGWFIEPQAQVIYQTINFSDANDTAAQITFSDVDSFTGRIGARIGRIWQLDAGRQLTAWVRPNIWHEFRGKPVTRFSSEDGPVPFRADLDGTWSEINLGASGQIDRNLSLFMNASYSRRFDGGGYEYNGKVGLRFNW